MEVVMPRYEVSGPIDADIKLGVGHVEVIASDRTDAVVEIGPSRPGRSGDASLAREGTASFEGGRLRVNVPRRRNLFGQSDSVDVRVELTTGSLVTIETAYGSLSAHGVLGNCRFIAKYGNVSADTVGDLILEAPYGTVEIAEVTGRLDATTGYARARIDRILGDARFRGAHGTIELGTSAGDVDVATSGPLTIERALSDVTARSAHGQIRVREVNGGSIHLENAYGGIEVGVPAGIGAWIDAVSAHGRVRNELTPDPEAAASERSVELRLRSSYGDLRIRRAAGKPTVREEPSK
jgi:hypothetical protein